MTMLAAALVASMSLAAVAPSDLAGCYELSHLVSGMVPDVGGEPFARGYASLDREIVRCLSADGHAIERRTVTFHSPAGGRARQSIHAGVWSVRGNVLRIRWGSADGGEWEVESLDGGLDIGGELWRSIDLDPAELRAQLEAEEADDAEEDGDVSADDESDPGADEADEEWADSDVADGDEDADALGVDDPDDEEVEDL